MSERDPADTNAIFEAARERGRRLGVRYAGAVTPREAHALRESGAARIVDVRTPGEWRVVGHVEDAPLLEWPREGTAEHRAAFLDTFREHFAPDDTLLLLCRSGVRSHHAAELLAGAGFQHAFNILEGFEGDNGAGANGWRAAGLPWKRAGEPPA